MSFNDDFRDADALIMDTFGEGAAVTKANGSVLPDVQVIVDRDVEIEGDNSRITAPRDEAEFLVAQVGSLKRGDTFVSEGVTFKVIEPIAHTSSHCRYVVSEVK